MIADTCSHIKLVEHTSRVLHSFLKVGQKCSQSHIHSIEICIRLTEVEPALRVECLACPFKTVIVGIITASPIPVIGVHWTVL